MEFEEETTEEEPLEKVESVEERIERLADEKFKKHLEDEGLLKTESGLPSGAVRRKEEIIAGVASGDISIDEAIKAGVTFQ